MTDEAVEKAMGLLSPTLNYDELADCDLVIEAVYENMDVKKQVFAKLDEVVKQGAILASNTSYLNIDEIAQATKRPGYVLGLHFFSPANVMKLLEIVRGKETRGDVLATCMKLAKTIGKVAAVSGVCPGFIGTRWFSERFGPETYARIVEHNKQSTPLGRAGTPEDIAEAVAFFCGEGARHITGETLHVNGGMYMP
jgi:3-hydroxyacyl-CoA dehydrogenase